MNCNHNLIIVMSRKRSRTELAPSSETRSVLSAEYASAPTQTQIVRKNNDTTTTYGRSVIKGKDVKDYMLNTRKLTDLLCPKWSLTMRSYGFNFAGGHYGDDTYGGHKTSFVTAATGTATDSDRFAVDDCVHNPAGWCDTIAWEAGTQGWYESVFLPASWRVSTHTDLEKLYMKNQCSMEGIIENAWNILPSNFRSTIHPEDYDQTSFNADFAIHYNGGSQQHTFSNISEFRVYYEAYEVIPRETIPWFYDEVRTNTRRVSRSVAEYITADYVKAKNKYTGGLSASTAAGNYQTGNPVLNESSASLGQTIARKEDFGFKPKGWQDNLLTNFKVSKGIHGSIEPGGKFVYTMKTAPFFMMNSAWRRVMGLRSNDANPNDDTYFGTGQEDIHLVPKFSKILVVRFYSDVGANGDGVGPLLESANPHQVSSVARLPGRVIHYMTESHTARCIPQQNVNNHAFKDFMKAHYNQTATEWGAWMQINDETDQTTQIV